MLPFILNKISKSRALQTPMLLDLTYLWAFKGFCVDGGRGWMVGAGWERELREGMKHHYLLKMNPFTDKKISLQLKEYYSKTETFS